MANNKLSALSTLSKTQKSILEKGKIYDIADLILNSSLQEIARRCRISPLEAKQIIDAVYDGGLQRPIRLLEDVIREGDEKFTTGDPHLDNALGGGIRTGMIWEIAGESAAGKTQLALQLSLLVQIPPENGGLSGSACYLTTSSKLPTSRLAQISEMHPLLSSSTCGLQDVHTIATPTIPVLIRVLSQVLPDFIGELSKNPHSKPVKFLVIDALAELFHSSSKTTTSTLIERSENITEISTLLHTLASTHWIAILVLNEVTDAFDWGRADIDGNADLVYNEQARWFSRADSVPGEDRKEASLGLVWANQVNTRILLSRTSRRKYLSDNEIRHAKRRKVGEHSHSGIQFAPSDDQLTPIRRLSIIFSSVSRPASLDYIVSEQGVSILSEDDLTALPRPVAQPEVPDPPIDPATLELEASQISPLDVGFATNEQNTVDTAMETLANGEPEGEDEWEKYWDEIPEEAYEGID